MTHDELLAKILETGFSAKNVVTGNWVYEPKTEALRAVVELHKPSLTVETNFCNVCWAISEEHNLRVMPVVYPCPTIQGIEKELA